MVKISALPQDSSPSTTDSVPTYDVEGLTTKRVLLSDLLTLFFTQTSIPAGGGSPVTRHSETMFDFVASGGVWTADSAGVNRNASMTAMVCYINGRRISIAAVTARTFTASVDTYIDALDNLDGTGTLVYTTAVNNAASAALASNSLRIGIIVAGATTIATSTSINQGQESRVLPIASSVAYSVTDSLGNLICPRDSGRKLLGYRQMLTTFSTSNTTATQITGLNCPVIVPTGRKVKITVSEDASFPTTAVTAGPAVSIWDGTVGSGTQITLALQRRVDAVTQIAMPLTPIGLTTPAASSKTYGAGLHSNSGASTVTFEGTATSPGFIMVELT
jgi:hypothetical protein